MGRALKFQMLKHKQVSERKSKWLIVVFTHSVLAYCTLLQYIYPVFNKQTKNCILIILCEREKDLVSAGAPHDPTI